MATPQDLQIQPQANPAAFEDLCADLFSEIYSDPNTRRNGRNGQGQKGIDVWGYVNGSGDLFGIQCKAKDIRKDTLLTEKFLRDQVKEAKKFRPKLKIFILATTKPDDANLQELARIITQEHKDIGLFRVDVIGWNEIKRTLNSYPNVLHKYYSDTWLHGPEMQESLDNINTNTSHLAPFSNGIIANATCPACGSPIPEEALTCKYCGKQIIKGATKEELQTGIMFGGVIGLALYVALNKLLEALFSFSIPVIIAIIFILAGVLIGSSVTSHINRYNRRVIITEI